MIQIRPLLRLFLTWVVLTVSFVNVAFAGAWGEGSFENDDALDWANGCTASTSIAPVRAALEGAVNAKYVEAPEGSSAIVAAEIVAAARGKASPKMPPALLAWTKRQPARSLSALDVLARKALVRLRDPKVSELRQLWEEQGSKKWLAAMTELEARLR